jgi:hypothetical protein
MKHDRKEALLPSASSILAKSSDPTQNCSIVLICGSRLDTAVSHAVDVQATIHCHCIDAFKCFKNAQVKS